jgi:L-asparaginase
VSAEKLAILATGGTIAGTSPVPGDNLGYKAAQLRVEDLLASVPALAGVALVAEQVAQVDSKDMTFETWRELARRCSHWLAQPDIRGLVITHGTDTLEETAFFLQSVLGPAKPVVLTCAMRPATALAPDGPQNLLDATSVAACPDARGVVAVCAGTIHGARDVSKRHTWRLDAFSSGDAGPIGHVEEGRLRLVRAWPEPAAEAPALLRKFVQARRWPRVEIVLSHAGASGGVVGALVAQGVEGIVVAGSGNGSVHRELEAALLKAREDGVKVVRATRCAEGEVLARRGDVLPHSAGLSPVKARIALMLALLD